MATEALPTKPTDPVTPHVPGVDSSATPRAPRGDTGRGRNALLGIWSALALLFLLLPIAFMIVFSFNDNKGRFNFEWQGFTLKHWAHPFQNPDLAKALQNSLEIAVLTTIAATLLGTLLAIALVRHRFRGRSAADFFVFLPMASPEVVMGASLLAMFLVLGIGTGFVTILLAHIMFSISYVVVTVKSRLEGMDPHIEEAARDLGANEVNTFFRVTLPMIAPGVAAAAVLAFALSIDDYVITSFNAGQTQTFPLFIFGATRQGVPPQVNVLSTMLLLLVLLLMLGNVLLQRRLAKRDKTAQAS
jgi:spermidine/putrescine transport system permease protein